MSWIVNATNEDFQKARRQAFISRLLSIITRSGSNELLPFEEVRARLNVRGQRHLGLRQVQLDHIVGSEGRYSDFDRRFAPLRDNTKFRWLNIDRAYYLDTQLPAVDLYKVGEIYFVKDGNHRISVARQRGQADIDALVTELIVDVPLDRDLSLHGLLIKEEYSDFLDWTGLADVRPEQRVEFSELGGYLDLIRHINAHRYYMGLEQDRPIERDEAVADWYDNVYLPVVEVIRARGVLSAFPERTEADLYRWIMDHRWYMREANAGADPGPLVAVADYTRIFGRKSLARITEQLLGGLRGLVKIPG
jgi:hypothetical protein